jgi:hypothetical protein
VTEIGKIGSGGMSEMLMPAIATNRRCILQLLQREFPTVLPKTFDAVAKLVNTKLIQKLTVNKERASLLISKSEKFMEQRITKGRLLQVSMFFQDMKSVVRYPP